MTGKRRGLHTWKHKILESFCSSGTCIKEEDFGTLQTSLSIFAPKPKMSQIISRTQHSNKKKSYSPQLAVIALAFVGHGWRS